MKPARDERLDLFRGLALIFIFVNHIPQNVVSFLTNRSWGFSDATEIFVFVSGYAAALAYGHIALREGYLRASLRVLGRVWQLYAAHILLFVVFVAQIAYLSMKAGNPMLAEEMAIIQFMNDPVVILIEALQLKFRPVNMDVLPLYMALLLALPLMLWLLPRRPLLLLAGSAALYAVVQATGVNLPAYPEGSQWFFNPFGWQFLFVLGALAATRPDWIVTPSRAIDWLAGAYLLFALVIVMSWSSEWVAGLVPAFVESVLYPIKKTDLDPLRLLHFLALAYVALRLLALKPALASHKLTAPIRAGIQRLKALGADVVLMDPQYAPRVLADPDHLPMVTLLAALAREEKVGLFGRFELMHGWQQAGLPAGAMLIADGLHHNDLGYHCLAGTLATALSSSGPQRPTGLAIKH